MTIIKYSDHNGYGVVHAINVSAYVCGAAEGEPVNPIFLMGTSGTLHFGTNRVIFQMD